MQHYVYPACMADTTHEEKSKATDERHTRRGRESLQREREKRGDLGWQKENTYIHQLKHSRGSSSGEQQLTFVNNHTSAVSRQARRRSTRPASRPLPFILSCVSLHNELFCVANRRDGDDLRRHTVRHSTASCWMFGNFAALRSVRLPKSPLSALG